MFDIQENIQGMILAANVFQQKEIKNAIAVSQRVCNLSKSHLFANVSHICDIFALLQFQGNQKYLSSSTHAYHCHMPAHLAHGNKSVQKWPKITH